MHQLFSRKFNSKRILLIFVILLTISLIFLFVLLKKNFEVQEAIIFEIESGQEYQEIFANLAKNNLIKAHKVHLFLFKIANKLNTKFYFQAGEYLIEGHDNYLSMLKKFIDGEVYQRKYTIVEGSSNAQIIKTLNNIEYLTGEITTYPTEGYLLPDTYFYQKGDSRQEQIDLMQDRMLQELDNIWNKRAENLPLKHKQDLIILASIVEKETGLASERNHIAGIFVNRINKKMKLQSDPTVIYAITKGKYKLSRPLSKKDLRIKSDYNTYYRYGLPPSAITNPGLAALRAAAEPLETKDLYFVSNGNGGHYFAQTLIEHNKNVRKLRIIEKMRKNEKKSN
ncbi:MAG: endolytic transglycosylase MltG [Rickettsiales bacterium]